MKGFISKLRECDSMEKLIEISKNKLSQDEFFGCCKKCIVDNIHFSNQEVYDFLNIFSSKKLDSELIEYSFKYRDSDLSNFILKRVKKIPKKNLINYISDVVYYTSLGKKIWFEENINLLEKYIIEYSDEIIRIFYYGYPKYVFKKERVDEIFQLFQKVEKFSEKLKKFIIETK